MFTAGGALVLTQEEKKKLGEIVSRKFQDFIEFLPSA